MIATRQFESGRHNWSSNKLDSFGDSLASPRMSNVEASSVQPDWREQYSQFSPQIIETAPSLRNDIGHIHQSEVSREIVTRSVRQRQSAAQLQDQEVGGHTIERPGPALSRDGGDQELDRMRHDSLVSSHSIAPSHSIAQSSNNSRTSSPSMQINNSPVKAESYVEDDMNDDMGDAEEDYEDDDGKTQPLTGAEKRKLKRFRLTHQQTRFLLAEFAKQNHPDNAHRDRLAREIPNLTSRQVQVWFQNRRAKMKRLNNGDRERYSKMRQMPENFDNVQALHSTYGAIHGMGNPTDYNPGYPDQHSMRPLLVDTMRGQNVEDHMSPTGMTLGFQQLGFQAHTGMGAPDMLSPVSINSANRYYSGQHQSPNSDGLRSAHPLMRHSNSDGYPIHPQDRHAVTPLQPLQLRETMSRNRSESLQSPLRTSMSWKENTIDYSNYPDSATAPMSSRQHSMYQQDSGASNYTSGGYNNNPSQPNYPTSQTQQQNSLPQSSSRFRSTSAAYPPNIDIRPTQYRSISSHPATAHPSMQPPNYAPTPRNSSFLPMTTTGFQSAPLNAPSDFQLPRDTSNDARHPLMQQQQQQQAINPRNDREYHLNQSSTPMSAPSDFSYQSQSQNEQMLSPNRTSTSQTQDMRRNPSYHLPQEQHATSPSMLEHRRTSDDYDTTSITRDDGVESRKYSGY